MIEKLTETRKDEDDRNGDVTEEGTKTMTGELTGTMTDKVMEMMTDEVTDLQITETMIDKMT